MTESQELSKDEQHLARLGYSQELNRSWSGFSNFAISFSIISILSGCFTTFGQAWSNGGPVAITFGWPVIAALILVIGLTMSELVSAYPTSGGIYWWASKMGGPAAGFFTGWLNLIGLLAVTASVAYGAATFLDITLSTLSTSWAAGYSLTRVFELFVVIMVLASLLNIFGGHLMALINNVSVWWHVFGVAVIIAILIFIPDHHQNLGFLAERINNSGFDGGSTSGKMYWFLVLPLGFLLTQYTITGYDASAHLSEETSSASNSAAKGIWQSIAYSAIGGWLLLLAILFAVVSPAKVTAGINSGLNGVDVILGQSLGESWHVIILVISTAGQLFCATACLTSASRMTFAFSRDGAIPGSKLWSKVAANKVPVNAVIFVAGIGVLITLPALIEVNFGTDKDPIILPTAFYAVVSIAVIGLYLAFAVPIFLRWRQGDRFEAGEWNNGSKYKWMNLVAVAEIVVISIYFILPIYPTGVPWNSGFELKFVNYAPILTFGTLIALTIWWFVSAKNWFTGPKHTFDSAVTGAFED